jgi:hypothetical protein
MTRDELLNVPVSERAKARLAAQKRADDALKQQVRDFMDDLTKAEEVEGQRDNLKRG